MVKKKLDDGFIKNVVRKKFIRRKHELLNKHSDAEKRFIDLLINANLYFIREKCSFKYSRWCYYDFYLPLYRIYIEIDGRSHDNAKQKEIDAEKNEIATRSQGYCVRFTNEEVMNMAEISIDDILDRYDAQMKSKPCRYKRRQQNRDYRIGYYNHVSHINNGIIANITRDLRHDIPLDKEVYLYNHDIGDFFMFDNVLEAKIATGLPVNEIAVLLSNFDYKPNATRVYVFGWSMSECEANVAKVYY